jgi:hypothetical protein
MQILINLRGKLFRGKTIMQVSAISNVGVYRKLNGHTNGQSSPQKMNALNTAVGAGAKAKVQELAQARQAAHTGHADAALMVVGPQYMRRIIQQRLQDIQSGCQAGPLPTRELIAQDRYRAAMKALR